MMNNIRAVSPDILIFQLRQLIDYGFFRCSCSRVRGVGAISQDILDYYVRVLDTAGTSILVELTFSISNSNSD